jgi:hypothetical protein
MGRAGSGLLDKLLQMGKSGSGPDAIMNFLEEQKPEVKNHEIWQNLKGMSSSEIETYAGNLASSLGLTKSK